MNKQKGITPIIAILVILLITVAIAGSAWIYISTYYSGMTSEAVEITSIDCTAAGARIYMHNIGTDSFYVNTIGITREVVSGDCTYENSTGDVFVSAAINITWDRTQIGPGEIGIFTDIECTKSLNATTARYTILAGGRVQKVQMNC